MQLPSTTLVNIMCLTCISHLTITEISLIYTHTQYQKAPRIHSGALRSRDRLGLWRQRLGPRSRIALFLVHQLLSLFAATPRTSRNNYHLIQVCDSLQDSLFLLLPWKNQKGVMRKYGKIYYCFKIILYVLWSLIETVFCAAKTDVWCTLGVRVAWLNK